MEGDDNGGCDFLSETILKIFTIAVRFQRLLCPLLTSAASQSPLFLFFNHAKVLYIFIVNCDLIIHSPILNESALN